MTKALLWWFIVASQMLGYPIDVIGPFQSREQCTEIRGWVEKQARDIKVSPCWSDAQKGAQR